MKDIKDILFITQARLGSTRVPGKMLLPFGGSTLVDVCLAKIKQSDIPLDQFYFSVHEPELIQVANKHGVQVWERGERSANSEGADPREIYSWNQLSFKWVVLISACNPFLKVETINRFIEQYKMCSFDSLFGVVKKKTYYWDSEGQCINRPEKGVMNTKLLDDRPIYEAGHVLYSSPMSLLSEGKWMGDFSPGFPALFVMDEMECLDIDYEWQFKAWDILYKGLYNA